MTRCTPARVITETSCATSIGRPLCARPPTPEYSPSEFSRTITEGCPVMGVAVGVRTRPKWSPVSFSGGRKIPRSRDHGVDVHAELLGRGARRNNPQFQTGMITLEFGKARDQPAHRGGRQGRYPQHPRGRCGVAQTLRHSCQAIERRADLAEAQTKFEQARSAWNKVAPTISAREAREAQLLFDSLGKKLQASAPATDVKSTVSGMLEELNDDIASELR
jgi:hypothetical protein